MECTWIRSIIKCWLRGSAGRTPELCLPAPLHLVAACWVQRHPGLQIFINMSSMYPDLQTVWLLLCAETFLLPNASRWIRCMLCLPHDLHYCVWSATLMNQQNNIHQHAGQSHKFHHWSTPSSTRGGGHGWHHRLIDNGRIGITAWRTWDHAESYVHGISNVTKLPHLDWCFSDGYSDLLLVLPVTAAAQTSAANFCLCASWYMRCSHASSSWVSLSLGSGTNGATRHALDTKRGHICVCDDREVDRRLGGRKCLKLPYRSQSFDK